MRQRFRQKGQEKSRAGSRISSEGLLSGIYGNTYNTYPSLLSVFLAKKSVTWNITASVFSVGYFESMTIALNRMAKT